MYNTKGLAMKFPFDEVNDVLDRVDSKFTDINAGGCGVVAYILARQISKIAETRIVCYNMRNISINKARQNVTNNTLREWNKHQVRIDHAWVEFKVNNKWYGVDSKGIRPLKNFRDRHGNPTAGSFTLREMREMGHSPAGWNNWFDRQQIPGMKRLINTNLNKLFGEST